MKIRYFSDLTNDIENKDIEYSFNIEPNKKVNVLTQDEGYNPIVVIMMLVDNKDKFYYSEFQKYTILREGSKKTLLKKIIELPKSFYITLGDIMNNDDELKRKRDEQ